MYVDAVFICSVVPNCVIKAKSVRTRVFVSDEIEDCKDLSGLYYLLAFQKVSCKLVVPVLK